MKLKKIIETCIYSDKLDESKIFYSEILGLPLHSEVKDRHLFFRCEDGMFMVFNPRETAKPDFNVPIHGSSGPGHVAFAVQENEFQAWLDFLEDCGIRIEKQINWPYGGKSIYFRDPSHNSIELTTPATWQVD
jgi:catechol 2,3-dioxygenase-like lactoylglutathione lyase family enzyme